MRRPKKIIFLILLVGAAGFLYWQNLNAPVDPKAAARIFIVAKGESAGQVAFNLNKAGLIKSPVYFKYRVWRGNLSLQAGEYSLSPALKTGEIIALLAAGAAINRENTIRIIEGWSNKDVAAYLEKNFPASAKNFSALAGRPVKNWQFAFLRPDFLADAPAGADLEGFLFPDTYKIFEQASSGEVIEKMLNNFGRKLTPEMRAEIKRQNKSIFEVVILASIVEKEVRTKEDMKIAAGIFWRRQDNGIALNSCATLAYVLGVNKPQYSLADTKIDSPYNTYRYRGLPPGPIANPGLNAIMAAIYPTTTEYNYFLSDPATGKTIFSRTLEEHNANKARYLK